MMNLMNLMMMILCKSPYLPDLTFLTVYLLHTLPHLSLRYLTRYHLNTPQHPLSSAHLILLASFVVRKALNNKEGR